jgi:hypothetical protein
MEVSISEKSQGRSQSLVSELLLPLHTDTATKPLPTVGKTFLFAVLQVHEQDSVLRDRW